MGVFTGCLLWRADRMNLTDGSKIGYPNNELEGEYLKSTIQSVASQVCKKLPSNSQVKNKHQLQTKQKETKVLNTRLIMFHESPWNPPSCTCHFHHFGAICRDKKLQKAVGIAQARPLRGLRPLRCFAMKRPAFKPGA